MSENRSLDNQIVLNLEEKAAQILLSFRFGKKEISDYMVKKGWGGIHLSIWDYTTLDDTKEMIDDFRKRSKIPPFISSDTETGFGQVHPEATEFTTLMGISAAGNIELAQKIAEITAKEASSVGLSWLLSPVADINTNPLNPGINIRSYGVDAETVCKYLQVHISGYQKNGVMATVKHFPGAGHTNFNSHYSLERVNRTQDEMRNCELKPFENAIRWGVEAVMTGHVIYSAYDNKNIVTLSNKVVTGLLRKQLGFKGLVITDGMEMKAVKDHYSIEESIVKAIQAGHDMIIAENDYEKSLYAIVNAVKKGSLSEKMLDERIKKILLLKQKYGLFKSLKIKKINLKAHKAIAEKVALGSIHLERDKNDTIPLRLQPENKVLLLTPLQMQKWEIGVHYRNHSLISFFKKYHENIVEENIPNEITSGFVEKILISVKSSQIVIFDTSFMLTSGQLGILSKEQIDLLKQIQKLNSKLIILAINPFVIAQITFANTVLFTYSKNEYVMKATAAILFGKNIARGGLPAKDNNSFNRVAHYY